MSMKQKNHTEDDRLITLNFFCFIPLNLRAKLEFQYIGIALICLTEKVKSVTWKI